MARAEGDLGLIPASTAEEIASAAEAATFDPADIGRAARSGANPVIPFVAALRGTLTGPAAGYVHYGATSQDILDTAGALISTRACSLIDGHLVETLRALARMAADHLDTLTAGRTLMRQAAPTTFGLKAAGWISALVEAGFNLRSAVAALSASLGGAVGTLAAAGESGPELQERFADKLGLAAPALSWHTNRVRVATLGSALAILAGAAGKVAGDIILLSQDELGEVAEGAPGGSSAMPHKRNAAGAVRVVASARQCAGLASVLTNAMVQENERAAGGWQAEWQPLSDLLALTGGAVHALGEVIAGLRVDTARMAANLELSRGALMAERLSHVLGAVMGRDAAQAAISQAAAHPGGFAAGLRVQAEVVKALGEDTLAELLVPSGYLGASQVYTRRAITMARIYEKER
ncbi:MAG: lyase family protein [Actinomycetota bacterium]|nr:lyase family protein [Actinomycetota bacterium]